MTVHSLQRWLVSVCLGLEKPCSQCHKNTFYVLIWGDSVVPFSRSFSKASDIDKWNEIGNHDLCVAMFESNVSEYCSAFRPET